MSPAPDVTDVPAWGLTSASARGSSHGEHGPNQDAVRCEQVLLPTGDTAWLLAVSDGHGGRRYVRSDVGSRLAVEAAVDHLAALLAVGGIAGAPVDMLRHEMPGVVARWRREVTAHRAAHPFTRLEGTRAGVRLDDHPLVAYGATLLVALVCDDGVALAQIGDGDALVRAHGFATRPVPGDTRLVAGETTSLCMDSAVEDFRFAWVPGTADPDLLLLASDGYGNSFADPEWWHSLVDDIAGYAHTAGFDALRQQLPEWLAESALVGGDDVTAALLVRRPLSVPPNPTPAAIDRAPTDPVAEPVRTVVLPPEPSRPPTAPEASTAAEGTKRSPTNWAVVALLAVGVLAVLVAILLTRGDDATPPPRTTESVSPTPTRTQPTVTTTPSTPSTTATTSRPRRPPPPVQQPPGGSLPTQTSVGPQ